MLYMGDRTEAKTLKLFGMDSCRQVLHLSLDLVQQEVKVKVHGLLKCLL